MEKKIFPVLSFLSSQNKLSFCLVTIESVFLFCPFDVETGLVLIFAFWRLHVEWYFLPVPINHFPKKSKEGCEMTCFLDNWYTIFKRYTECNQLTCVALGPLLNPNSWSSIRPTVVVFTDFFLHMVLPPWCLQSSSCRESRSFLWRMIEKSIIIKQFLIDQINNSSKFYQNLYYNRVPFDIF